MEDIEHSVLQGQVVWFFGRPCAGKTTIAGRLAEVLRDQDFPVITLDGDELRGTVNRDLNFSPQGRTENIRRSAEIAGILANKGFIVLCSFVTPTNDLRNLVRNTLMNVKVKMVYIKTSLEECKRRDSKGQYKQAQAGRITDFTGIGSPFEEPADSYGFLNTEGLTVEQAVAECLQYVIPKSGF